MVEHVGPTKDIAFPEDVAPHLHMAPTPNPALPASQSILDLPDKDVNLPTIHLPSSATTDDWLSVVIGDADPTYMDFQEVCDTGRPSLSDEMEDSNSDDDDKKISMKPPRMWRM